MAETKADFERSLKSARPQDRYVLRLYVTGMTPRSTTAIQNIKAICEQHLQGRYELEVVDVYKHPGLAKGEQIIAAPTLDQIPPLALAPLHRRHVAHGEDTAGAGLASRQ